MNNIISNVSIKSQILNDLPVGSLFCFRTEVNSPGREVYIRGNFYFLSLTYGTEYNISSYALTEVVLVDEVSLQRKIN